MYELQQAHAGAIDFPVVARREGKVLLRQYLDGGFHRHYNTEQGDAVLDAIITELLAIVAKVTTFERAMAN